MRYLLLYFISLFFLVGNTNAQENKLKIIGAYIYKGLVVKNLQMVAIEVTGDVNLIGDPDDITFADGDNGKSTGFSIDDFSFLSPDGKEAWMNLPKGFNKKEVHAVFITAVKPGVKKIKITYDGVDISDTAAISGYFPALPKYANRVKHKKD